MTEINHESMEMKMRDKSWYSVDATWHGLGLTASIAMSSAVLLFSTSSVFAHTNSVGFIVGDENTDGSGNGLGTFDVEFFYGTWHTPLQNAEGGLEVWSMTDPEFATYTADPAAALSSDPDFGTRLIDPQLDTSTNTITGNIPFAISPLFPTGTNYRDTNNLPPEFTAGVNYFFAGEVTAPDGTLTNELIGTDGVDFTNPVTDAFGNTVEIDGAGPFEHQSATATLAPGNYRFFYDAVTGGGPSGLSATWDPQPVIRFIGFTISSTGGLQVSGAPSQEDQRPGIAPVRETVSGRSVLERVLGSTRTISSDVTAIFSNTADNIGREDNIFLRDENRVTVILASRASNGDVTFTEAEAVFDADTGEWLDARTGNSFNRVETVADLTTTSGPAIIGSFMLVEGQNLYSDESGKFYAYDPFLVAAAGFGEDDGILLSGLAVPRFAALANSTIDASVLNRIDGFGVGGASITSSGALSAVETVTANIGNITTVGIGSVNNGNIDLRGANAFMREDLNEALSGGSSAISKVAQLSLVQLGADPEESILAIHASLNEMNVNASVRNIVTGAESVIGRSGFESVLSDSTFQNVAQMDADRIAALTGGVSTTAIGAVNTTELIAGTNARLNGMVTSIVSLQSD